jgi:LPXTG-motif cell wall-anchored protein
MPMRRLGSLALVLAVLVLPLVTGVAMADNAPDHLHVDVRHLNCQQLQVSGYELPKRTRLELRYVDAGTGRPLGTTTVRTEADGRFATKSGVPLNGVRTIRVLVQRSGSSRPLAFGEEAIQDRCRLPFTGPHETLLLTLIGITALLLGSTLLLGTSRRGRHLVSH